MKVKQNTFLLSLLLFSVLYYQKGSCQQETYSCLTISARFPQCPLNYDPVCSNPIDCSGPDCLKTFDNVCSACSPSTYTANFTIGLCQQDKLNCSTDNSDPSSCPAIEDSVCAILSEDPNTPAYLNKQTVSNSCQACSSLRPLYYTEGPCTFNCVDLYGEGTIIDCVGSQLNPVCGYYSEDCTEPGGICTETYEHSCAACSSGKVVRFTEGGCPINLEIRCDPNSLPNTCLDLNPVCGALTENCNDSSCRKTFENSCEACQDTQVISYTPNPCPGDAGVPCDTENRPNSAGCPQDSSLGPICGYASADCNDSPCRQTFGTTCLACADPSINFYNLGGC